MAKLTLSSDELAKIGTEAPKGRKLDLGDLSKQPRRVVGAGWDPLQIQGMKVDIDIVTAMLSIDTDPPETRTESGLFVAQRDRLVHYNPRDRKQKVRDASGAVEYQGDSVDGSESVDDEDEMVIVDFSAIPADVVALMTFVNIHKQSDYPDFVKNLTFDAVNRAFVSSFPEGTPSGSPAKRVISLAQFGGTDTVVVKFDWRQDDGTWTEEFIEKHVAHLDQFAGQPDAGFRSVLVPYGVA